MCADLSGHHDPATDVVTNCDILMGDFRATADGALAVDSTGTEDYVDNAMFFADTPKATPFAQNWARAENTVMRTCQVSFCRWQFLGSEIHFQHDFRMIRELSQYDTTLIDRQHTVAFLYLGR